MTDKAKREKGRARQSAPLSGFEASGKPASRIRRYFAPLLILTGCLVILFALFASLHAEFRREQLVREYGRIYRDVPERQAPPGPEMPDEPEEPVFPGEDDEEAAENIPEAAPQGDVITDGVTGGTDLLGVLSIPGIDLQVAIGEGTDDDALKYSVGHFIGTALPGETGNCCIAGHRNYTWGRFFNRLNEIAAGDEIIVERGGSSYTYTVTETFVVNPEDTWVLNQTEESQITLITCTPIRVATQRLIVRGTLTS